MGESAGRSESRMESSDSAPASGGESDRTALTIRHLLKPHYKSLAAGLLAVAGGGLADLAQPLPLKLVIDTVLKGQKTQGWLNNLVVSIAGEDRINVLKFTALIALAIALFGAACSFAQKSITTTVGQRIMHELRRKLYSHIQRLSLAYHDQKQTGDLISRVTSDIDSVQSFISSGLLDAVINVITLVGMVAVMFYINWRFTLIALSVVPFLFAVVYSYTRRIKKASRAVRKKEGEIVSVIQEVFSSIRVVRAFAREDYEQRRLEVQSMESVEMSLRARSLKARLSPLVEIIVAVGTSLVLWFGARMVLDGSLSAGSLIVFFLYLGKMYKPMQDLSKMTDSYSKAAVAYDRIREIMETDREVKDLPGAVPAPPLRGEVEFDNVSFSYEPKRVVLHDVSFRVEPGHVAAFVGPTGAGKTTIISLIPRFYDPTSGVVKIDGFDIRRFQQKSLRQQISFVLQETLLFHGTIWSNIAYGKPGATEEEILHAAELANAHEFIEKMPDGYDTVVGERGVTVSGGQRQRIAIARAIIRNSPILILDEPSSGLDAASEKLVFDALDNLMKDKTSIVIAHRLSTIRRADLIFVVKDGAIREHGKHEELMALGGLYAELHELQFRQGEEDRAEGMRV
jgi:ATP-binding cassette subfamily B protein